MRTIARLAFIAGSLTALAHGCGCASTIGTLAAQRPYAGTVIDTHALASADSPAEFVFATVDLPLSFALDTAVLPLTVPCAIAGTKAPASAWSIH